MRILGIDPGLQITGFGLIDVDGPHLAYVASGTIRTAEAPRGDLPARIRLIFDGVREVVSTYQPDAAALEIVFVNVNPQSTLLLGQARGAALGHGGAAKAQIQAMVQHLLKLPGQPGKDAADALGIAITHAHASRSFAALAQATPLARRQHALYRGGRSY
ncbi:MAG: crossover junction endodeoxyribonuclease RuvC [Pseudomonadota bacterium]